MLSELTLGSDEDPSAHQYIRFYTTFRIESLLPSRVVKVELEVKVERRVVPTMIGNNIWMCIR